MPWGRSSKSETSLLLRLGPLPGEPTKVENLNLPVDINAEMPLDYIKATVLQTCEQILRFSTKKNKDWFDEKTKEIQEQWHWWGRGNLNHSASRKRQTSTLHTTPFGASFKISSMSGGQTPQWELSFVLTLLTTGDSVKFWGFLLLDPEPPTECRWERAAHWQGLCL